MNNLVNFERIDFSDVRFHEYDGKLWFFGEDIAKALKYPVAVMDIEELVDAGDFDGITVQDDVGEWVAASIINESGVLSFISISQFPSSKREFERWVESFVIPSLRETVECISYILDDDELAIMYEAMKIE